MRKVCVITGGGSGMGLGTAKILGKNHYILIAGRTKDKLEKAQQELEAAGIKAEAFVCDISDGGAVKELAERASQLGTITAVINAAGLSPNMGDARTIMETNALGTINVQESFFEVMKAGACLINVASLAGHLLPKIVLPAGSYKFSKTNQDQFLRKMMSRINLFPQRVRSDMAYGISKHFVIWYSKTEAAKFGAKGIRVMSVSPGMFETPMVEKEREKSAAYVEFCAIKRFGQVDEIAHLLAFCAGDKVGYLTGTDILCDGGFIASGFNPLKMRRS